jgi:predicted nuclease of predicted toxin-antitoxin system
MNLYVDEDSVDRALIRLLQRAGHDVQAPSDVGFLGRSDPVQLPYAIRSNRSLLSANYDDFRELHDLIVQADGKHPGILMLRRDNDRQRDLSPKGIVIAIAKLLAASAPIESQFIILNHWR